MTSTSPTDDQAEMLDRYQRVLFEIRRRTEVLQGLLDGSITTRFPITTAESGALQLRKILELVAFGSLIANETLWREESPRLQHDWKADRILNRLERLNPNFYPVPSKQVATPDSAEADYFFEPLPPGSFLDRARFQSSFDYVSNVLHISNPFQSQGPDASAIVERLRRDLGLTIRLLNHHSVHLNDGAMIVALLMTVESGDPSVHLFQHVGPTAPTES